MRNMLEQVLKTNDSLYFAILTGCLRVSKESIFTGLNNTNIFSIIDEDCDSYFGFTDYEVRELLEYYELSDKYDIMKAWYNGYRFGDSDVYCPWDVLNQCDKFLETGDAQMEAHWENSSSNTIVQNILENATETTKSQIESLISGERVEKALIPELTYTDFDSRDIDIRQSYLWSVLFAAGYITDDGEPENGVHTLAIPNKEVLGIYDTKIHSWLRVKATGNTVNWHRFCSAFKEGDAETIQVVFNEFMADSISIRDTYVKKEMKENFYHGILLGLLGFKESWGIFSNR